MLLSIVIPTYNRSIFLAKQLEKIGLEFCSLSVSDKNSIDIWVFDNKSSDSTQSVISEYKVKFNFLKVFTQESNVGLAGNLLAATQKVEGEYIWFLSDDDFLENDVLVAVINALKSNNKTSYLFINYKYGNKVATKLSQGFYPEGKSVGLSLFRNNYGSMVFISAAVYKRDILLKLVKSKYSQRISSPMFFSFACCSSGGVYIVSKAFVTFNSTNRPTYNGIKNVLKIKFFEYYELIKNLGHLGYSNNEIDELTDCLLRQNSHSFLMLLVLFPGKAFLILRFEGVSFLTTIFANTLNYFRRN